MYRKEVNAHSPLRILEQSIHGGLGKGNLGLIMSRHGVGKTATLVQIGLDDLMRERDVLHITLEQTLKHVTAFYDALFDEMAHAESLRDAASVRESVMRRRAIKALAEGTAFTPERLDSALDFATRYVGVKPTALLIDGYGWQCKTVGADLAAFKAVAKRIGAELWMTMTTPSGYVGGPGKSLPETVTGVEAVIDCAVYLEPRGNHVALRLVKDHGNKPVDDVLLEMHSDTMRLAALVSPRPASVPTEGFTLLSGAAPGAEAEFGACAERLGLAEENYSFAGRKVERNRGLVELNDDELRLGDVSDAYLKAHMHRSYPSTPLFRKVMQSIWHQVSTAAEVFAVGKVMPDGTVKGGTGWGVELAKHWKKPVFVFDQETKAWSTWQDGAWTKVDPPTVTRSRFAGTGTRFLEDAGREAIRSLFSRSFGNASSRN